jgi:hypothetical protein
MISLVALCALCVVVAVAHAAVDASFSAFQLTLNMALSSSGKKRQTSSCTPAEVMAIQGAAQAVSACLQGVSMSNNTQLCACYTTVREKNENDLQAKHFFFFFFFPFSAIPHFKRWFLTRRTSSTSTIWLVSSTAKAFRPPSPR